MEHHGASPAPGGLVAFAVACYTFFGVFSGMVDGTGLFFLGCWLLGGFVIQLVVACKELDHGVQIGGNVFLFLQGFFMLAGGISSIGKYLMLFVWETPYSTVVEGFGWLACTLALMGWTPAYLKTASKAFSTLILLTDLALIGVVLNDFGVFPANLKIVVAILLLIAGTLGLYCCTATQLQAAFGREILPVGKPFLK